jgi:hypothetical protein
MSQICRLCLLVLGFVLLIAQQAAHADLWAYVDERGVTHFATEPLDERYQLFFKGSDFDSTRDSATVPGVPAPASATSARPPPASAARLVAMFERAPDYRRVREHLRTAASRHGVDYALLQALVAAESGFDATAVSPKGAIGLMQVMPDTAVRFGVRADARRTVAQKLADPAVNVSAGTGYLRYLLDLFPGRLDLALAAYNAGEGAVRGAGHQIPPYRETRNYVGTVLGLYEHLRPPPAAAAPPRAATGRVRMQLVPGGAAGRGNLPPGGAHDETYLKTAPKNE